MNVLDVKTLFISNAFTSISLGFVLFLYYFSRKTFPGFLFFMLSSFMISAGYIALVLRNTNSFNSYEVWQVFFTVSAFGLGSMFRAIGISRFAGIEKFPKVFYALLTITIGFCLYFTGFNNNLILRNLILSLFLFVLTAYIVYTLFKAWEKNRSVLYAVSAAFFFVQGLAILLRALLWFFQTDIGLHDSSYLHTGYLLSYSLMEIMVVVGFIMMNGERLELDLQFAEKRQIETVKLLEQALLEIKVLGGLLPICASCKMIRDDKGYWSQLESFIKENSEAEFSHSICPECAEKLYPEEFDSNEIKE
jgi:hypothetical protein